MNASFLQKLGLTVQDEDEGLTAEFEPASALINPINRQLIGKIAFTVVGDRLVVIDPPALVGSPPIALTRLERSADLEEQLSQALTEIIANLQRRTSELQHLGVAARVDPESLVLTADVEHAGYRFSIGSDKRGTMRVTAVEKDTKPVTISDANTFDLSEFRERTALINYLRAMVGDTEAAATVEIEDDTPKRTTVTFADLVQAFGEGGQLPQTSSLETVVELEVGDQRFRFAAARVSGRTFRGLLAGSRGKVWAERFELDEFPGVVALVAELLKVPMEEVTVLGGGES